MDSDALFEDVLGKYSRHINPYLAKLQAFAGFGVETYAEGCYIYDHEGRKLLDCLGGYGTFAVGHRNPKVVEAVKKQLDSIALSGKAFFTKPAADLAERLAGIAPSGLEFCFFCNSGAEAVEAALKFAKGSTGRTKLVSTEGSFHGKTLGALSVTGREKYRKRFEPLIPGVVFVPYGDSDAAVKAIDSQTAAFIVEPIQGEGGIIVPPDGYLMEIRRACDKHGTLFIADEVQTGLGRTGRMFAVEWEGVNPDLMTLAKSLGGGVMPLGCCMGTDAIWTEVYGQNPLAHTSTFGANALACAAGIAALDVIEQEDLVSRSKVMGDVMLAGMQDLQSRHSDLISEVRGRGLMVGVEFAMDEVGELTVAQMLKRGLCVAYALNNPRVLRFEPPLIITEEQVHFAVDTLDAALVETKELLATIA
ncbi:MAG: putrescine aminotransferase [Fimbriimonadaceae bacterium]|jgi:putrescine aminotransferase|nr:putrescine aminotransferase [Fimbriimonadaceae bacterium]